MDDNWDVPYQNLDLEFELDTVHEMCLHEWVDENGAGMPSSDEHVDVWVDESGAGVPSSGEHVDVWVEPVSHVEPVGYDPDPLGSSP